MHRFVCRQKQEDDAEHVVSLVAGILDLDLYADDDNDIVSEHAADVTARDAADDDEQRIPAAETSHQSHPDQPPPAADTV